MKSNRFQKHHRLPRSQGGGSKDGNIVIVPSNLHRAYHVLFANMLPEEVAKTLTDTWIDPKFELIAKKKEVHSERI